MHLRFAQFMAFILVLLVGLPAMAQLKLPGKKAASDDEGAEEDGSGEEGADALVAGVVGGFRAVASTFESAARASMRSNENLMEAFGLKEQSKALRLRMDNLKAIEDPQERLAQTTAILSDPQIELDIAEAAKNTKDLDVDRRKNVSDANLWNLRAALTFTNLVSDTVQLTSAVAQLGLGLTSPVNVAALDRAGKNPEWFKKTLKPSLSAIDKGAKAFDKAAKKNGSLMTEVLKRFEIKAPDPATITPVDESSDF